MMKSKKKIILSLILAAILAGAASFWFFQKPIEINKTVENILSKKGEVKKDPFLDEVIFLEEDQVKKINIQAGEVQPNLDYKGEEYFAKFDGMPKLGNTNSQYRQINRIFYSQNSENALVQIAVYDSQSDESVDQDSLKSIEGYLCEIEREKCKQNDVFLGYENLEESVWKDPSFVWSGWDSEKSMLIANFTTKESEDNNLVYVCMINEKKCEKSVFAEGNYVYSVPFGFVNPLMDKFALVARTDEKSELQIFALWDLSKPLERYDITGIAIKGKEGFENVSSISWNRDGKKIALGTEEGIFVFDTEKKNASLVYLANGTNEEESTYYWDYDNVTITPDARYIAFADTEGWLEDGEDETEVDEVWNIKRIDIQTGELNKIYSGKELTILK